MVHLQHTGNSGKKMQGGKRQESRIYTLKVKFDFPNFYLSVLKSKNVLFFFVGGGGGVVTSPK